MLNKVFTVIILIGLGVWFLYMAYFICCMVYETFLGRDGRPVARKENPDAE